MVGQGRFPIGEKEEANETRIPIGEAEFSNVIYPSLPSRNNGKYLRNAKSKFLDEFVGHAIFPIRSN